MLLAPLLSLVPLLLPLNASPVLPRGNPASVLSCLSSSSLAPITAASAQYSTSSAAFNQRVQPSPLAIIYPTSPKGVSAAVKCAIVSGVPVSARGGGHSYASFGLGGTSGALVIDLAAFNGISVYGAGWAKIGAGSKLGDVAVKLASKGRALPHGVCPFVGIGGHASYGGFGLASRMQGLTVDHIIGLDVVLANGTILTNLTASRDADLFWALRGSAPSFGLITSFYVSTFVMPPIAINFSYTWYGMTASDAAALFGKYQAFGAANAPKELGISFTVGSGSVEISGVYYGTMDAFHDTMVAFVQSYPTGFERVVNQFTWIESLRDLAGSQGLTTSGASDYRDDFFAKSLMTPSDQLITPAATLSFFNYLFNTPTATHWFVEVNLYGGVGSAVNARPLSFNSFGHRNKLLTFQMYASSPNYGNPYPAEGLAFVNGIYNSIQQPMSAIWNAHTPSGAYSNYGKFRAKTLDLTLGQSQVANLYWVSQYARLQRLRTVYDPTQVFRNPQSIVPA